MGQYYLYIKNTLIYTKSKVWDMETATMISTDAISMGKMRKVDKGISIPIWLLMTIYTY